MFLKIERIYITIQKYFPFLPNSPASKIGLSEVVNKKRSEEAKNLIEDEDIKKTFEFYIENHKNIRLVIFTKNFCRTTNYYTVIRKIFSNQTRCTNNAIITYFASNIYYGIW